MPVVAVVAAAASYSAAATVFAGAAAWSATAIAAGAVMVGSAMTIAGTLTGNKKLTKYGAILGVGGGLGLGAISAFGGGLDTSAAATAGDVAGNTAQQGFRAGEIAAQNNGAGAIADTMGLEAATSPGNITDAIRPTLDANPAQSAATSSGLADKGGLIGEYSKEALTTGPSQAAKPGLMQSLMENRATSTVAPSGAEPGMWQKFQSFVKQNPEMAKMGFEAFQQFAANLVPKPPTEQEAAYTALMQQRTADDKRRALAAGGYATGPTGLINSMYYNRSSAS